MGTGEPGLSSASISILPASSWDSKGSVLTSLLGGGCTAQMGRQFGSVQGGELAVPSSAPGALSLSPSVPSVMFTNSSWNPVAKVWEEGKYHHDVTRTLNHSCDSSLSAMCPLVFCG